MWVYVANFKISTTWKVWKFFILWVATDTYMHMDMEFIYI